MTAREGAFATELVTCHGGKKASSAISRKTVFGSSSEAEFARQGRKYLHQVRLCCEKSELVFMHKSPSRSLEDAPYW